MGKLDAVVWVQSRNFLREVNGLVIEAGKAQGKIGIKSSKEIMGNGWVDQGEGREAVACWAKHGSLSWKFEKARASWNVENM
jgi:hypothetical protein